MTELSELGTSRFTSAAFLSDEAPNCDHPDEWLPLAALAEGAETFAGMVVQSPQMHSLIDSLVRVAPHKTTVLIQGESGTGKELVAEALHRLGPTPGGPFVIFNCSNLIGTLADAQLFGHVRGAFTDAREDSLGYFRSANGGTVFLDEIGELPLQLQPKLLRVLETYEVQPVGSTKSYKTDVRVIAATNRDLFAMVKSGEFREDLYHRLNAIGLHIPELRERRNGKEALVAYFVERGNKLFDKQVSLISRRAMDILEAHHWSGNVRELANTVQAAVMLTCRDRLCISDFPQLNRKTLPLTNRLPEGPIKSNVAHRSRETSTPLDLRDAERTVKIAPSDDDSESPLSLQDVTHRERKKALVQALHETGGNCSRAAKLLGVSRFTVYRLMERYGLTRQVN
jgi:transcriptional regulator with GAF, ATPase, and Fis domain